METGEVIDSVARRLGYDLKEEQKAIINSFVQGNNVFGILPTGFGKSLCYQLLPMIYDELIQVANTDNSEASRSIVIVISPLISIIKDQVRTLQFLNSESKHYIHWALGYELS